MEGIRKSLQVTIENCEFAKEFHYFLTVQLDGEGEKVMFKCIKCILCRGEQMCQLQLPTQYFQPIPFIYRSNSIY